MPYCRSCGLYMSESAGFCPTCGAAVSVVSAPPAADAPTLIATFRQTAGLTGKTITYAAGRFTLEGHGEITPRDVLAYDAEGKLDWAHGGLRDWVVQVSPSRLPPAPITMPSQPTFLASGTTQPSPRPASVHPRWLLILVGLCLAMSYLLNAGQGRQHYVNSPATWLLMGIAAAVLVVGGFFGKRTASQTKPPLPGTAQPPAALTQGTASQTTPPLPDTAQPPAALRRIEWWIRIGVALVIGVSVALAAHRNGFSSTNPGLWLTVAFAVGALFTKRQR